MDKIELTLDNFENFQNAYLYSLALLMKNKLKSDDQEGREWLWNTLKKQFNKEKEQ